MSLPNIVFYFSDQQRFDTVGAYGQKLDITPNLDRLAANGVLFERAYTPQPVCGPCRALFQTGKYPTQLGCFRNNIALPQGVKTLADYLYEAGYDCGYVGKWHLASSGGTGDGREIRYQRSAVPLERRGGYKGFWRAADVLEATSHGYDGFVFDENMNRCDFYGYRTDCITDYALEYLDGCVTDKPFFLTVSHIEPHHQNDRRCYEGPEGSSDKFKDYELPGDLKALKGNADEMYPDYLGACRSLDDNLGRIVDKLKKKGMYENTVFIYTSDHGSHFMTRNQDAHLCGFDDYKRSCHSACLQVPLILSGPGFDRGRRIKELVSTAGIPKTILACAGIDVGENMVGEDLHKIPQGLQTDNKNYVFAQISESRVGRCVRTEEFLYSVYAPGKNGSLVEGSDYYEDDFLYDLKSDPYELNNLIDDAAYEGIKKELAGLLIKAIYEAEGRRVAIGP